ncbi:two-component system, response regulator YesN [Alteribacillus persepolensis]|uniref:Two-component system, response regulator YesN n=1 Tax=Alteribacillus persepolensis TaxID=568899 RepID=A0A1G8EIE7_9BACI|nr:hypothetical protein [Alteribacillus persepolensis]SDH69621.1 two-component system, response regulator YesN [Alteribacillus persepolensis]
MLKVILVDDETTILEGLTNSIDWAAFDMQVVGRAKDGVLALELIKNLKPDVFY